jgi:hypothetical protein
MGEGVEGFLLCRIIPADSCLSMAAVTAGVEVFLLTLGAHITIYSLGVVLRETGAMKVLVNCRLITLGLECSGVEGGCASNVNGL